MSYKLNFSRFDCHHGVKQGELTQFKKKNDKFYYLWLNFLK